ncbi:hypothetical protein ABKN59_011130 [Abortiporus biennis]
MLIVRGILLLMATLLPSRRAAHPFTVHIIFVSCPLFSIACGLPCDSLGATVNRGQMLGIRSQRVVLASLTPCRYCPHNEDGRSRVSSYIHKRPLLRQYNKDPYKPTIRRCSNMPPLPIGAPGTMNQTS